MKLNSYTNYALRSLQLAALRSPNLIRVDDVAKIHNLSRPHIMKIVHIASSRGPRMDRISPLELPRKGTISQ